MDQSELEAHEELMQDFRTYLRVVQGLTPGTARAYVATLSGAIKKGTTGYEDEAGIRRYYEALVERQPATASTLQAVWRHFHTYMKTQHGETICVLGDASDTFPEAAVVDLQGELRSIPISEFVELRWGAVRESQIGNGGYEIKHVNGAGKHMAYVLSKRGVAALQLLATWGYPSTARNATSPILPQAPNDPVPITRQRFSYIRRREMARRQQAAQGQPGKVLSLVVHQEAEPAPETAPAATPPAGGDDWLEAVANGKLQEVLRQPPPAPLTEAEKLALYQRWLVEAPPDNFADSLYTDVTLPVNTPDKVALARWRRVQWALGRPNDLGPPPQSSNLSTPSPSTYAPLPPAPAVPVAATPTAAVSFSDVFDES